MENVQIGTEVRQRVRAARRAILGLPHARRAEREGVRRVLELLDWSGSHRTHEMPRRLPYGEQRRLEIARALGTEPSLLLLDEPAAGTNPAERHELVELIRAIAGSACRCCSSSTTSALVMSVATAS